MVPAALLSAYSTLVVVLEEGVTEASVRAALVKKLRAYKDWTVLRHEDHYTSGIPDISVTGNKITSWWECKLRKGSDSISTIGIQQFLVEQLAKHGHAYYIVYEQRKEMPRTLIYEPEHFPNLPLDTAEGFNHDWVVNFIRKIHR